MPCVVDEQRPEVAQPVMDFGAVKLFLVLLPGNWGLPEFLVV